MRVLYTARTRAIGFPKNKTKFLSHDEGAFQMKSSVTRTLLILSLASVAVVHGTAATPDLVKTANGTLKGMGRQSSGVRIFKGVPFAQPPTGDLRWKEPQRVK